MPSIVTLLPIWDLAFFYFIAIVALHYSPLPRSMDNSVRSPLHPTANVRELAY